MNAHSNCGGMDRTYRITRIGRVLALPLRLARFVIFALLACIEPLLIAALSMLAVALFGVAGLYALAATPSVPVGTLLLAGAGCAIAAALYSALVRCLQ